MWFGDQDLALVESKKLLSSQPKKSQDKMPPRRGEKVNSLLEKALCGSRGFNKQFMLKTVVDNKVQQGHRDELSILAERRPNWYWMQHAESKYLASLPQTKPVKQEVLVSMNFPSAL